MKKVYLLLGLLVFIVGCEKDEFNEPVKESQEIRATRSLEYVSYEKAPKIIDAITSQTGKSSLKTSSHSKWIEYENAFIDLNSILKVSNNERIVNYSFMLEVEGAPANEFYNVVVNQHPKEGVKSPYVLKYIVDEDALDTFIKNKRNFRYFKGRRVRMPFNGFFGNSANKSSDGCGEEMPINNTGGGSNGDFYDIPPSNPLQTNPSIYDYAPTVTPGSSYELFLNNYSEGTQGQTSYSAIVRDQVFPVSHISSSGIVYNVTSYEGTTNPMVGFSFTTRTNSSGALTSWSMTTFYANGGSSITERYFSFINLEPNPDERSPESISKTGDGCDGGGGEIGIITSQAITYIEECLYPTVLTGDQLSYLESGGLRAPQLRMYLQEQGCSQESKAFTVEAIDAWMVSGEVDFVEEIIYTSNVKECVKDIIKKMLNDNEFLDLGDMPDFVKQELNLSGFILDIFNHSDKYSLIFDSAPNLVNRRGQTVNANTTTLRNPEDPTLFNFTITLNSDFINNATDLVVARTIIHESLHAYISFIYQEQILSTLSQSLTILLQADGATPGSAQHNLMTQQFVNAISNSLESWDNSSITNNEYYNNLSWSGDMLNSPAFNSLTQNEQDKIRDANIAEGTALSIATGLAEGANNCN